MSAKKEMIGLKFNMLTVLSEEDCRGKYGAIMYLCLCDCNNTIVVSGKDLRMNRRKSCGCLESKHNLSKHYFYKTWYNQYNRCNNEYNKHYVNYGGRGIQCLWTLQEACEWADNNPKPGEGYQLDRIDNDGNYCSENVRWATMEENYMNKRNNVDISKYEFTPITLGDFKKRCKSRNIDYNNYDKIYSGIKTASGNNKYFFIIKQEFL